MHFSFGRVSGELRRIAGAYLGLGDCEPIPMKEIGTEGLSEMAKKTRRHIYILRQETGDAGTFGSLTTDSGFQVYSLELPWRQNKTGISCIPAGDYECVLSDTPKHGKVYEVKNVPGRTAILLHGGNWGGDVSKGLKSDVEGCILPGRAIGDLAGQPSVMSSRDALRGLMDDLDGEPALISIRWADAIKPQEEA